MDETDERETQRTPAETDAARFFPRTEPRGPTGDYARTKEHRLRCAEHPPLRYQQLRTALTLAVAAAAVCRCWPGQPHQRVWWKTVLIRLPQSDLGSKIRIETRLHALVDYFVRDGARGLLGLAHWCQRVPERAGAFGGEGSSMRVFLYCGCPAEIAVLRSTLFTA